MPNGLPIITPNELLFRIIGLLLLLAPHKSCYHHHPPQIGQPSNKGRPKVTLWLNYYKYMSIGATFNSPPPQVVEWVSDDLFDCERANRVTDPLNERKSVNCFSTKKNVPLTVRRCWCFIHSSINCNKAEKNKKFEEEVHRDLNLKQAAAAATTTTALASLSKSVFIVGGRKIST